MKKIFLTFLLSLSLIFVSCSSDQTSSIENLEDKVSENEEIPEIEIISVEDKSKSLLEEDKEVASNIESNDKIPQDDIGILINDDQIENETDGSVLENSTSVQNTTNSSSQILAYVINNTISNNTSSSVEGSGTTEETQDNSNDNLQNENNSSDDNSSNDDSSEDENSQSSDDSSENENSSEDSSSDNSSEEEDQQEDNSSDNDSSSDNESSQGEDESNDDNSSDEEDNNIVELTLDSFSYGYSESTITVNEGQTVKVTLTNSGGFHDFVIDELGVSSGRISQGGTVTFEFVASQKGTFEYYCSVGSHRALGMVGNLIVQ